MDVGTVTKREIRWGSLNDALADMTLNLDHEYVQYVLSNPRRSLCVIYQTVATHGDTEFDSDSSEKGIIIIIVNTAQLQLELFLMTASEILVPSNNKLTKDTKMYILFFYYFFSSVV